MPMTHDHLVELWSNAQVLSLGPTWQGEPPGTAVVEQLVAEWPKSRDQIVALLNHPIGLVAAHALFCLHCARDPMLSALDAALLESTKGITIQEGSFRTSSDLGSLARKWAKDARVATTPDPPRSPPLGQIETP